MIWVKALAFSESTANISVRSGIDVSLQVDPRTLALLDMAIEQARRTSQGEVDPSE